MCLYVVLLPFSKEKKGFKSLSLELCGTECSLGLSQLIKCMFGFVRAERIALLCKQHLIRGFIIMAVKSIKPMVPPGHFCQLLFN